MSGSYDDGHVMGGIEARADAAGTIEELRTDNARLRVLLREGNAFLHDPWDEELTLWKKKTRAELGEKP